MRISTSTLRIQGFARRRIAGASPSLFRRSRWQRNGDECDDGADEGGPGPAPSQDVEAEPTRDEGELEKNEVAE